jgi:hypothetical protein
MARNVRPHNIRENRFFVPPAAHPSWRLAIDGAAQDSARRLIKPAEFWARLGV